MRSLMNKSIRAQLLLDLLQTKPIASYLIPVWQDLGGRDLGHVQDLDIGVTGAIRVHTTIIVEGGLKVGTLILVVW